MGLIPGFDLGKVISDAGDSISHAVNDTATAVGHAVGALPPDKHITGIAPAQPIQDAAHWVDQAGQTVGKAISSIPVIGQPLNDLLNIEMTPFRIGLGVAQGQNVDRALLGNLKSALGSAKEVAPYVQAVVSIVPGIGPIASSAIAAGLTIAEGKPIDQVMEAALANAVPGGTLAMDAFRVGQQAMQGKVRNWADLAKTTLDAAAGAVGVQIPDVATKVIAAGLDATQSLANGTRPDQALLASALPALGPVVGKQVQSLISQGRVEDAANAITNAIPGALKNLPKAQVDSLVKGLHVGAAVGHAQFLQGVQKHAIASNMPKLGKPVASITLSEQAMRDRLAKTQQGQMHGEFGAESKTNPHDSAYDRVRGFDIGLNVSRMRANPHQIDAIRHALRNSREQDGFDTAISMWIGQATSVPPASARTPELRAGYFLHQGIRHSDPQHIANVLASMPTEIKAGAAMSARETAGASALRWGEILAGGAAGGLLGLKASGPIGAVVGVTLGALGVKSLLGRK